MKQVLLLGDSLRMGYQPVVKKKLEGRAGVSGPEENGRWAGYTLNSLRFWLPWLPKPEIIHWNCGLWDLGDDYGLGRPFSLPDEYESALERTITVFGKLCPGAAVIMATTMPTARGDAEDIKSYNEILKNVAKRHNIEVNDLFAELWPHRDEYIGPDTIHLTPEGYEAIGGKVAAVIEKYL